MQDDQQVLNEGATEAPATTPVAETEVPQGEQTAPVESTDETGDGAQTEAAPEESQDSKKGAQARIRELVKERNEARTEAKSLADKMSELTGSVEGAQAPQYTPQVEPGAEITPEQYQADVARQADAIVQLRLKQQQMLDRVNRESTEAIKSYPQLDPKSDVFDEELSESVSKATLAHVRVNPGESVTKFVDSLMKPYLKSVAREIGKVQGDIAKQASQTALRPTQAPTEEKKFEELSLAEMERRLGVVQP